MKKKNYGSEQEQKFKQERQLITDQHEKHIRSQKTKYDEMMLEEQKRNNTM